jgi:hypothetical protein
LTTHGGSFQKFEFEIHAGIVSNTWWAKIQKIVVTVSITVLVRLNPAAMLVDVSAVEPSPLCPDLSHERWRREGRSRPDPSPLPLPLCKLPTGVVSPAPTHRAPPPRQNTDSTRARPPRPVLLIARRQGPRTGELLDALAPDSLAYKNPRRAHK